MEKWRTEANVTAVCATRLEAGVQPAIAAGCGDNGRELVPRGRVVEARVFQIVCHSLKALYMTGAGF